MFKIYNTMVRHKQEFKRREETCVKIFTCGPSIYSRPHIGNYRTFLYEDILIKYLEYLGYNVKRIINFTDIEDKTISEAENKHSNIKEITSGIAKYFYKETIQLNIKLPEIIPASSTTIKEAVELIILLLEKGYAYWFKGNVFFDPLKVKNFGKLFRLDMKRWPKKKVRFKKDTYTGRRWNLGDFILWHGHKNNDEVFWDTDIGKGRPSWNIQDPAIIMKYLGLEIDINCGGIDNIYRHHDYNIAILESISGKEYANYYLHGEHLIVNGKVMSKSLGNILYPEDILKKDYEPYHLRFYLIYTHYRKKLNYREKDFNNTCLYLDSFRNMINKITNRKSSLKNKENIKLDKYVEKFENAFKRNMDNDLSLKSGFDEMFLIIKELESLKDKISETGKKKLIAVLKKVDSVFGFIF